MKHMFDCGIIKNGRTTRADRILIALILGASLLLMGSFFIAGRFSDRTVAVVEQDGKELLRLSLSGEQTVRILWEGGYNVISVSGQGVRVSEADCPDQICVRQGTITKGQETIVCLPHRLLIRLEGNDAGMDAMTKGAEFEKDSDFEHAYRICADAFLCGSIDPVGARDTRR